MDAYHIAFISTNDITLLNALLQLYILMHEIIMNNLIHYIITYMIMQTSM